MPKDNGLKEMGEFFDSVSDIYDEHQQTRISGADCYKVICEFVPDSAKKILDLGIGTGLELEGFYRSGRDIEVTGIDLAGKMLNKLREKYKSRPVKLLNMDYFDYEYPENAFDAALSVMTLHHFDRARKTSLYRKILQTLKAGGTYTECDYMIPMDEKEPQKIEDSFFAEYARLSDGRKTGFYHFDLPCTVDNQKSMLRDAGFHNINEVWRNGTAVILTAEKL